MVGYTRQFNKRHGRVECREVWMVACEADMQEYLRTYFGWPGMQWCGRIRRRRWKNGREEEEGYVWVAGAAFAWSLEVEDAARLLRAHWTIENRVFYVRDVTMKEDRLHGRWIGLGLSSIRNVALSLLRYFFPDEFIPDAQRKVCAMPDKGISLLFS